MDVGIVALFPELLDGLWRSSIVGRAVEEGRVRPHAVQIRDFSPNKHRTVDDAPYGGGMRPPGQQQQQQQQQKLQPFWPWRARLFSCLLSESQRSAPP
jgi:tRNA (guanine-N1)-methyltransferase